MGEKLSIYLYQRSDCGLLQLFDNLWYGNAVVIPLPFNPELR